MALSVTDCSLLNDMVSKLIASDILTINSLIEYPHGDDRIAIILGIEYKARNFLISYLILAFCKRLKFFLLTEVD